MNSHSLPPYHDRLKAHNLSPNVRHQVPQSWHLPFQAKLHFSQDYPSIIIPFSRIFTKPAYKLYIPNPYIIHHHHVKPVALSQRAVATHYPSYLISPLLDNPLHGSSNYTSTDGSFWTARKMAGHSRIFNLVPVLLHFLRYSTSAKVFAISAFFRVF